MASSNFLTIKKNIHRWHRARSELFKPFGQNFIRFNQRIVNVIPLLAACDPIKGRPDLPAIPTNLVTTRNLPTGGSERFCVPLPPALDLDILLFLIDRLQFIERKIVVPCLFPWNDPNPRTDN